eukprot:298517-Pyramimonas_sp.AAC.1
MQTSGGTYWSTHLSFLLLHYSALQRTHGDHYEGLGGPTVYLISQNLQNWMDVRKYANYYLLRKKSGAR